eukprot:jgi/Botrbrau1/15821/Bobra.40_1s0007.1
MQTFVGKVVSNKMQKSILVAVSRWAVIPKYKLRVVRTKKFMAHDEKQECNIGDMVRIQSCRPLSKRKAFTVTQIMQRARIYEAITPAAQNQATETPAKGFVTAARGFAASAL